ncbi:hypothetical protein QBC41DRAFT_350660 [Cercophora samala]|uniref:Uncharacterized protein n=1 Tax=Cercophora samala TaxID=330535 RepID=A0AA40D622_9PEZI|nr:hypothetical protein QBC41DRAFT_350660 [Cercophora samala]
MTRETNALFTTNGVTIAVGLDAIFGLALVIFLSGVIYQWKRGQRLRAEQEERNRVTDGVEVTPAVSVSKESSQLSTEIAGARVKVVEEQFGDEEAVGHPTANGKMAVFSNTSSCEESNQVARFNPAPTFDNNPAPTFANNNPGDSTKRVSKTSCYWPDGTPADGSATEGDSSSLGPLYPCLDPGKTYSPSDSVVCCWPGTVCFGEANLCGVPETKDEGNAAMVMMYRGGCTAQPDAWGKSPGCPQKCLDHSRPFENALNGEVVVMSCDDSDRADNLTLFCANDALDPTKCDHDGALEGYNVAEVWGMMASETLEIHGTAFSTITSIPLAKGSSTSSTLSTLSTSNTASTSSSSSAAVVGTPPANVTAPNSPNTTTIILAVGIPLGLLFFFGMVAVAFVCYRRRHAPEPEPEQKRSSFPILNVKPANTQPTDTNSLGTVHSERHAIPGPLSSNPILPLSPSDSDLATLTSGFPNPPQPIHTFPPPSTSNTIPYISHPEPPPTPEGRPSTPTPWPVSSPFIHAYANPNLTSNRNSSSSHTNPDPNSLRKSHTQPSHLSPDNHNNNNRESYHSTASTTLLPFPSYSEPNIGLFPPNSGPQFPFYSREVHQRLQEIEFERGLDEYYGRGNRYLPFSAGGPQRQHNNNRGDDVHELPGQQEENYHHQHHHRPVSQEFEFDFQQQQRRGAEAGGGGAGGATAYEYGRPAVGVVGRAQVVEIGAGGKAGREEEKEGGREKAGLKGGHGRHWSATAAGGGGDNRRGSEDQSAGFSYTPYRSSA